MAKLVDQMEEAILNGDWVYVCNVFNKMTGRSVSPPIVNQVAEPSFDYKKATKKELVSRMESTGLDSGMLNSMRVSELRELYKINIDEDEGQENDIDYNINSRQAKAVTSAGPKNISPNPEFTYVPENKKYNMLNGDREKITPIFKDFDSYGDEKPVVNKSSRPSKLVDATCLTCGAKSKINPILVIGGGGSDKKFLCPKCA